MRDMITIKNFFGFFDVNYKQLNEEINLEVEKYCKDLFE